MAKYDVQDRAGSCGSRDRWRIRHRPGRCPDPGGESSPIADYSIEGWQKVIEVNLNSVFYCMRAQIPAMVGAGGGSIVNMASILGSVGFAGSAAYVTAKHGVVGMSKNAALEYAGHGVRVNAVGPGFITTPLLEGNLDEAAIGYLSRKHALGRMGVPDEVARWGVAPPPSHPAQRRQVWAVGRAASRCSGMGSPHSAQIP